MSFLAWVFALGGLTLAFPILFHLIRPTPRGRLKFGSLMFLRQSPPRITRRSRIDNWVLLVLRGLVILLITAAFMRPFLRSTSGMFFGEVPGKQLAILIDTSGSMQRNGVWQKALARVRSALKQCRPGDQVALYGFADQLQEIVPFQARDPAESGSRLALISEQLKTLSPGFMETRLGEALISVARLMSESPHQMSGNWNRQILLVSDLQSGASLVDLQAEEWPDDIVVEIASVQPDRPTNATMRLASDGPARVPGATRGPRVRVVNNADSLIDQFRVAWAGDDGLPIESTWTDFYVPAGTSQVLPVPPPENSRPFQLVLDGDDCAFDNRRFVSEIRQQELSIDWIGDAQADDPQSALYFLTRVFPETASRRVTVQRPPSAVDYRLAGAELPQVVVVHRPVSDDESAALLRFVELGGTALVVVTDARILDSVQPLAGAVQLATETNPRSAGAGGDYAMLSDIDFDHPLFAPLAGARYSDFSKIRFWKTVPIRSAPDSDVTPVARFDNGNLAFWEHRIGDGTVIGLATSWEPGFSQLALSSRFLPLMWGVLGLSRRAETPAQQYEVGDPLRLPATGPDVWRLTQPDGTRLDLNRQQAADVRLDRPGRYMLGDGRSSFELVANLADAESLTTPMAVDRLESLGVRLGSQPDPDQLASDLRKMNEIQMEGRQRIWKWLILAALVLLIVETALAGRRSGTGVTSA